MHLRSLSLKGFKSFPHRTTLEFSPGVAVVVGPNGSGKSNLTDAVLWALGEQSPLAVRGQSMQDVIFAGGQGVKGSRAAEVELVIDNSSGRSGSDFSEISIVRRIDRSGEAEYRLNGARCRLADVAEVLSDTGLGKEMHSVVSQGRVESIVLSRPRERRLLVEEAAGLGKHRKRRRKAQLKLERTGDNLSRALDVERDARSRLRPLKRQAEAAQLHGRIQRQSDEARHELGSDDLRVAREQLDSAAAAAAAARAERDDAERVLGEVGRRREAAENAFAKQSGDREKQQAALYTARSAGERIVLRLERARAQAQAATAGGQRRRTQLELLENELAQAGDPTPGAEEGIAALEAELSALDGACEQRLREGLAGLETERDAAVGRVSRVERDTAGLRTELEAAERAAEAARLNHRGTEQAVETARARAAEVGGELASLNQLLRSAADATGAAALSQALDVEPGYELAVAAALGPRLGAGVVDSVPAGEALLDGAGDDGGMVIVVGPADASDAGEPPCPGAERLLDRVSADRDAATVAERLLAGVWLVAELGDVPEGFGGVAVTRVGRVWAPNVGELRQAPTGGSEQVLEQRNRRMALVAASERAARSEQDARERQAADGRAVAEADVVCEAARAAVRRGQRELDEAREALRRVQWLIERRSEAPDEGPDAVRRAELSAEIRAERRVAEGARREREEVDQRAALLRGRIERDAALAAAAERAAGALEMAQDAVAARVWTLEHERDMGAEAGEQTTATLRSCAHEEAEVQGRLRAASERVTAGEVAAAQARDGVRSVEATVNTVAQRLGIAPGAALAEGAKLDAQRRAELEARIERLARRGEQLGAVNPLAANEYEEAVAHVEELEGQRSDLEGALSELQALIRDTDRRIHESFEETFEATARNFEEVAAHLFPGGKGRLRLVSCDQAPHPVLGGGQPAVGGQKEGDPSPEEIEDDDERPKRTAVDQGIEIEVTPAGKSTKRLSLMSGGEKSLVALAFMFSVFLARPCPFYILDEVEAALDDPNVDRFLQLVRRYSDRAQFIVVTHQKRTMDAADCLYGVSMGGDGVSRVVSRKLARQERLPTPAEAGRAADVA